MTPGEPSDPPRRVAHLARGPFAYTDEGEGTPILAIHGLPGSVRDYRWLGAALEGRARLVRLEHPGFGETPRATWPGGALEDRVGFACAAADALGLEDYVVLGHSMGGPVAMGVAARQPARVRGLALLSSVGLSVHRLARRVPRNPSLGPLLESRLICWLLRRPMREGFVRAGFPRSIPAEALEQTARIATQLRFEEIRAVARGVRAPTLVAWAEDDRLVESAISLALGNELPPGPRLGFPDGGHNIQKTRACELADALPALLG